MPRNGSGVYSLPPGSTFTPNTLIQSSVVNGINTDLATDANTPRPIVAGGTGASTAAGARSALGLATGTFGFIYGLMLSNNAGDTANSIDIAAGTGAEEGVSAPNLMTLAATLTKASNVAWAVGSGNGSLDTGSIADGVYYVWLIQRSDTNVVDGLTSTSPTSPVMPASYDRKRRIGAFVRASGSIRQFYQDGDNFFYKTSLLSVSQVNPGTSGVLVNLSTPAIKSEIIFNATLQNSSSYNFRSSVLFSSPNQNDDVPSELVAPLLSIGGSINAAGGTFDPAGQFRILSDTSGRIRYRVLNSDASVTLKIAVAGWVDTRGRLG
ncbi:hypothetical protein [Rhizobium sp. BR 362]|uniref:hypothetical protein n=1 Tax=Rhizobium sp. BR 362 TaxID=3040670 RepID=UPI002F4265A2